MKSKTTVRRERTTLTPQGDEVNYETVTCSSCDNEVAKQNATRFVMGDVHKKQEWRTLGHIDYEFKTGTIREGWACEYCRDEGPISLPTENRLIMTLRSLTIEQFVWGMLAIAVLLLGVDVVVAIVGGLL